MNDQNNAALWKYHMQDEIDAAYLYRKLASLEQNEETKNIYLSLAVIEDKHAYAWKDLLQKSGAKQIKDEPSFKAKMFSIIAERFGTGLLKKMMLKEEATEVKAYMGLYNDSPAGPTKTIALQLAKDSAAHANSLMKSSGIVSEPWHSSDSGGTLRNIVYGFNDGLTANFGLIAGVIGAQGAPHFILISGIAGMIADSLSMGSSGYLAATSEKEVYAYEKKMEEEEIRLMPELETEELALIYQSKGMDSMKAHELAVEAMKNPKQVLEDKIKEELGMAERTQSPLREGWVTGTATAVGALIPIIPFFFWEGTVAIVTSFIISMLAHFAVGAARSFFTGRGIFRSGFDMFIVGFGVAAVGYFVGELITRFL